MITGAVFLFKKTKAGFVLLTGVLAIGAEIFSLYIKGGEAPLLNIVGLVAGVFAIIACRSFTSAASA